MKTRLWFTSLVIACAGIFGLRADVPPPVIQQLSATPDGSATLTWNATAGSAYQVLTSTDLVAGVWLPVDQLVAKSNTLTWQANGQGGPARFYKLSTDAITVRSLEPALLVSGNPTNLYITGQGFSSNDVITIGGVVQTNVQFLSSTLIQVTVDPVVFPTDSAAYDVQVSNPSSGQRSTLKYAWSLVSSPTAPRLFLEPPIEPPASPSGALLMPALMKAKEKANQCKMAAQAGTSTSSNQRYLSALKAEVAVALAGTTSEHQWTKGGGASVGRDGPRPHTQGHVQVGGASMVANDGDGDPSSTDCDDNDPCVMEATGEVQVQEADMIIPGVGLDFVWARTYRSRTSSNTGMAPGWTHSYDIRIQPVGGDILLFDGTGRSDRYYRGTNGLYTRPEFFNEGAISNNNIFTLTFPDSGKWVFNPTDASVTTGKLSKIIDRNGNTMSFTYDGAGRLAQIIDDLGRTNFVGYNSSGQLFEIIDFSGRAVTYQYYDQGVPGGSAGDLKSVTSPPVVGTPNGNDFPTGKTTTYTYSYGFAGSSAENHLLLTVTDPKNQVLRTYVYQHNQTDLEFLRCISAQHGTNSPVYYTHVPLTATPSNQFAKIQVTVRDAYGNVRDCTYDSRNRLIGLKEYTGRAPSPGPVTDTTNRPVNPLRTGDPAYYQTQWAWNTDSLCVAETAPDGSVTSCVYESDFTKNGTPRKRADVRVCRTVIPDDVIEQFALSEIVTHYQYDPRFGSGRVRKGFISIIENGARTLPRKGWDGTIKGVRQAGGVWGSTHSPPSAMASVESRDTLKTYFENGEIPTGDDFARKVNSHAGEECDQGANEARSSAHAVEKLEIVYETFPLACTVPRFTVTVTDARGNSGTGGYDSHGNKVSFTWHVDTTPPDVTMAYNNSGQLTTITNAPDANGYRRIDTFSYYTNGPQKGYCRDWTVDATGPTVMITTFECDDRGNVTRCIDPRTNDWLFTYNALDQLMQVSSPSLGGGSGTPGYRISTQYAYDAADNLIECDVENRDATGTLDATNPLWTTGYFYDGLNRCVRIEQERDPAHTVAMECVYDANDNLVLYRSGEAVNGGDTNKIVQYIYDERKLLYQTLSGGGTASASPVTCSYTLKGSPSTKQYVDSAASTVVRYAYDGFERLVGVTDAMGNSVSNRYDPNGNLVLCTLYGETNDVPGSAGNVLLAQTACVYDTLNRCTQVNRTHTQITGQPVGDGLSTTTYVYAPNGECVRFTDDNGNASSFLYDTACRLTTTIDPLSNSVACTYDPNGNVLTTTKTDKSAGAADQVFITTCQHDALNRCFACSDNVGNTIQYAYDSRNNLTRQTDANNNLTGWFYDGLCRPIACIRDLDNNGVLDFTADAGSLLSYDDNSCLLSSTDDNTNTTSYVYDSLNRVTLKMMPDQTHYSYGWNSRSDLITVTDPNGSTVTNTYDLRHNIIHRDIAARNFVLATTTFETFAYDGCGRTTLASNDVSRLTYAYDTLGKYVHKTEDGLTSDCTYDGVGNRLSLAYPGGRVEHYTYDAGNQLSTVTSSPNAAAQPSPVVTYAYAGSGSFGEGWARFDEFGQGWARIRLLGYANGLRMQVSWDGVSGVPNAAGDSGWRQVAGISHNAGNNGPFIDRRSAAYDHNQNKIQRAQLTEFTQGQGFTTNQWSYNPLNMMAHAVKTKGTGANLGFTTIDYSLDAVGNRNSVTSNGVAQFYTRDATKPAPADFQMDEYTTTPFGSELHDDNGNLVQLSSSASQLVYRYDYADQLVEVDDLTSGSVVPVLSFTYDALGHRLSKTVYPTVPPLAPVTTYCVYGGGETDKDCGGPNDILELRKGGTVTHSYTAGRFALDCITPPPPVASFNGAGTLEYYFHSDELGNVLALTDGSRNVLEHYEYDDYGLPQFLTSDGTQTSASKSAFDNPFLFHGMEWDSETKLYHSRGYFNYFNAQSGRYLLKAGVPIMAGQSAYSFAGNNPWSARVTVNGSAAGSANGLQRKMVPITLNETLGGEMVTRNILKSFFTPGSKPSSARAIEIGDLPTQDQFGDVIDSCFRSIPAGFVSKNGTGRLAGAKR